MRRFLFVVPVLFLATSCVSLRPDASKVEKWKSYIDSVEIAVDGAESVLVVECSGWSPTKQPLPPWPFPSSGKLDSDKCGRFHQAVVVCRTLIDSARYALDQFAANPDNSDLQNATIEKMNDFQDSIEEQIKTLHTMSRAAGLDAKPAEDLRKEY